MMKIPAPINRLLENWKPKLICLALAILVWGVVKREVNISREIYRFFRTQEMLVPIQALQHPNPPPFVAPISSSQEPPPPSPDHASLPAIQ